MSTEGLHGHKGIIRPVVSRYVNGRTTWPQGYHPSSSQSMSAEGLHSHKGIIRPVVSVSSLTWYIRYNRYAVFIIKANAHLLQTYVILSSVRLSLLGSRLFGILALKRFSKNIWLFNLLNLSLHDKGYFRKASYAHMIYLSLYWNHLTCIMFVSFCQEYI
jgi:hypothetical protein